MCIRDRPESPKLEALRDAWFAADTEDARKAICRDMQLQACLLYTSLAEIASRNPGTVGYLLNREALDASQRANLLADKGLVAGGVAVLPDRVR